MIEQQKRYRAAGIAVFVVAAGLLLCRIGIYFVYKAMDGKMSELKVETLTDIIFSIPVQIGFCFLVPMLILKKSQKLPVKQVFVDSNFKKTRKSTLLLAFPMGVCALLLTIVITALWAMFIATLGYNLSSAESVFPHKFNFGLFLLSIFLSCVLPGFCEEFAVRGTFLTSMKNTFANMSIIIVMAISFGLFHQNIRQVFYTAVFGGFLALIVIKTGSIFPAMIMHFVNNFLATLIDYGAYYKWGGNLVDKFYKAISSMGLLSLAFMAIVAFFALFGMTKVVLNNAKKDKAEVAITELYKPTLRESAFYIGAIVITAVSTILTFAFGF